MLLKLNNYSAFILVLFTQVGCLFCQHQISKYEYQWAVWHPIAALKIKHTLPIAMNEYMQIKNNKTLDTLENGGKLDAFRHVFTMALLSQKINSKKLKKLGAAHEKGNKTNYLKNLNEDGERADSLSCEMDLRNNELGFNIGYQNKKVTRNELKKIVITAIVKGMAWQIKRNKNNNYITCNDSIINLNTFKLIWFVPKCLVLTNN